MKNKGTTKRISRLHFLKTGGLLGGGMIILPVTDVLHFDDRTTKGKLLINGLSGYQLVIPANASAIEKDAAKQLQHYLFEMSAIKLSIEEEGKHKDDTTIYIGNTNYAKAAGIDVSQLKNDGIILKPLSTNYIIAGGSEKGVLYAVCHLLESIGFRKYTSGFTYVPKGNSITLPKKEIVHTPFITYRTTSYRDTRDTEYTNWHKLSSNKSWGLFVHTFDTLVSPDEFGTTHPEYFSLIKGSRQPGTQLCLSNQAVLDTLVLNLQKKITEKPEAIYWSVSQNDNDQHCQCDECTRLNNEYGGVPSGSIIYFVNQVAKKFPDKIISTLAYWYSRKAPKNIRIEPNVNIMLCNIESKRQQPVFKTDPAFSNDLADWGKLTGNILIWDYNIQFTNLLSPFPNLHTIKPNIKFYTENRVNALFMQANSQAGGEMAGLRAYLICKLMYDPDADDNAIIDDYLNGYYGAAGVYIRQYIDSMRESLLNSGMQLDIFGDPNNAKDAFLSMEMMERYKKLFDKAESFVAKKPELLKRVKFTRLPIMYAEIQIGRNEIDTQRSMFKRVTNGKIMVKPEMKALVYEFVRLCKEEGVTRLKERSTPPDDFLQSYNRIFTGMEEMATAISVKKQIIPITFPQKNQAAIEALTDGILGSYESWSNPDSNWVAYKGEHMDFVLDLGKVMTVKSVNMDFLNAQAQPDWNLMVLPGYVTYAVSIDGKKFSDTKRIDNPHHPNPKENPGIAKVTIQSFHADFKNTKARYIKVHAESMLRMPSWHIRKGQPAWIYSDEIVVK